MQRDKRRIWRRNGPKYALRRRSSRSLGQMVNVSKNSHSYSFVPTELSYTRGNVLVAGRNEYRVSEFAPAIGVKP